MCVGRERTGSCCTDILKTLAKKIARLSIQTGVWCYMCEQQGYGSKVFMASHLQKPLGRFLRKLGCETQAANQVLLGRIAWGFRFYL